MGAGTRFGLFVMLALEKVNYDYVCKGPVQGFKLFLHLPTEVPQVTKHFYRIPMEQEMIVVIKPKVMSTSLELKHHPISKRQCYFSDERKLKYFETYTQNNCEIECLADFTMEKCGCTRFNFPTFSNDVEICGPSKNSCLRNVEFELLQLQINQGLQEREMLCNCLPGCNSITYDVEISQSDFNMTAYVEARRMPTDKIEGLEHSRLTMFFKEDHLIPYKRSEMFSQSDLMTNASGLFGLFMGVSLICVLKIINDCMLGLQWRRHIKKKISPPVVIAMTSMSQNPAQNQ